MIIFISLMNKSANEKLNFIWEIKERKSERVEERGVCLSQEWTKIEQETEK